MQAREILRAENGAERADGKEKRAAGADPALAVRREHTSGDQAMDMDVLGQILAPGVEDRRDPEGPAEVARVTAEGQEGIGRGAEEQRVDHSGVALRERIERVRQGKHDVEVGDR